MKPGANGANRRHRGETCDASAAQQLEQQRFGLVVTVLSGDENFAGFHRLRQQCVTSFAGSGFRRILAARDFGLEQHDRHAPPARHA